MSEKPGSKPPQSAQESSQPTRLGGARADFVASLGRKTNDARAVLTTAMAERGTDNEKAPRDELRRRIHALAASAKMLRFDVMTQSLADAESALERASQAGYASDADFTIVANVLDDLPALAWGDGPRAQALEAKRSKPTSDPPPEDAPLLRTALLVGSEMLAEALTDEDIVPGALPYECERTDDAQAAIGLARRVAPDVVVIDADVADAPELVEALLDDPLTEPVPIVIVGAFREGAAAARYVALGVSRTLTKPITAEALRHACDDAVEQRNEVTMRVTLGEPTLEQLGERLADEVRKALVESVDATARGVRVPLGEGTEVMSAIWGAIARVREVVVARTGGAVSFGSNGPEGAVALAPWLHPDIPGTDRMMAAVGRGRGPAADVRLHGRRVIVADDDPGVTWFIADLLRTAGCNVHEALDGTTALDLAYRTTPELVISDILMPGLDGFALTRMLKRDVALRDVPVILLSWKEDLLQRVRELGASAAAYLRKESDSRSIVARVRECLRPRARVEARLRTEGEVRGRLDGLTVRSLLELACAIRPESRVGVRDASFLYEVEIRDGAPKRITRTSSDGTFDRGERVLAAMLGVGAGRFTVCSSEVAIPAEDRDLRGSLNAQIARPVALARASRNVTTGARTMGIERVKIDLTMLPSLQFATPEPARSIVTALAEGKAPRGMILGGEVDPMLLEEVLSDLALRGAIQGVWTHTGEEVLLNALEALLAPAEPVVRAAPPSRPSVVGRPSPRPPPPAERPRPPVSRPPDLTPSSLADAVMRELSDRAPELRHRSSNPPPIVEPSDLRPRSSKPPAQQASGRVPSIPPDAMVPDDIDEEASAALESARDPQEPLEPAAPSDETTVDARVSPKELPEDDMSALDEMPEPEPVTARGDTPAPERDPFNALEDDALSIPIDVDSVVSAPVGLKAAPNLAPEPEWEASRTPLSSVASRDPRERGPSDGGLLDGVRSGSSARWPWIMAIALVSGAALYGVQAAKAGNDVPVAAAGAGDLVQALPLTNGVPVVTAPTGVAYEALPEGLSVSPGQGLLEVNVGAAVAVRVDGVGRGNGPLVRVPLTAGPHEVAVGAGEHRGRSIEVRAGRTARVDLSLTP